MKEICGFKGLDGNFYEKEKDCKVADLEFKLKDVKNKMNSFERLVGDEMLSLSRYVDPYEYPGFDRATRVAKDALVKLFSERSNEVKQVYKYTEDLQEEAKELQRLISYESSPWWIKIFKTKP